MPPTAVAETPAETKVALTPGEQRHLKALEGRIERGLATFKEVGLALLEIRDSKLYRMTHSSFEAYCRSRWSLARGRAYQLMGAAEVAESIPHASMNEVQARELVPVYHANPDLVPKVWKQVEESGKPITGPMIRDVVRQTVGTVVTGNGGNGRALTATARFLGKIANLTEEITVWRASKPNAAERKAVKVALLDFIRLSKVA